MVDFVLRAYGKRRGIRTRGVEIGRSVFGIRAVEPDLVVRAEVGEIRRPSGRSASRLIDDHLRGVRQSVSDGGVGARSRIADDGNARRGVGRDLARKSSGRIRDRSSSGFPIPSHVGLAGGVYGRVGSGFETVGIEGFHNGTPIRIPLRGIGIHSFSRTAYGIEERRVIPVRAGLEPKQIRRKRKARNVTVVDTVPRPCQNVEGRSRIRNRDRRGVRRRNSLETVWWRVFEESASRSRIRQSGRASLSEIRRSGRTRTGHAECRKVIHARGQRSHVSRSSGRISGILPHAVNGNPILSIRRIERVSDGSRRSRSRSNEYRSSLNEDVSVRVLCEAAFPVGKPPIILRSEVRFGSEAGNRIISGGTSDRIFHFPVNFSRIRSNELGAVRVEIARAAG